MDGSGQREAELMARAAEATQPDEKRKRGIRAALERYYTALDLMGSSRRSGGSDDPLGAIDRIDPARRID